jgi:hypothetical protein
MIKTIDNITIIGNEKSFSLENNLNQARANYNAENGIFHFSDPFGNLIQNNSCVILINFEEFKLTKLGQTINRDNGTIIAYLSSVDVQELAEKTFYEEGQNRVYDFINHKFNVSL